LDVPLGEIFPDVLVEGPKLDLGERIQRTERRCGVRLEWDTMIVRSMRWKHAGRFFAEHVGKLGIFARDGGWDLAWRGRGLRLGLRGFWGRRQREAEELALLDGSPKGSGTDKRYERAATGTLGRTRLWHGTGTGIMLQLRRLHRWSWFDRRRAQQSWVLRQGLDGGWVFQAMRTAVAGTEDDSMLGPMDCWIVELEPGHAENDGIVR
jgi:hypothetical protein